MLKSLIAAFLLTTVSAHAESFNYSSSDIWDVTGDTVGFCSMSSNFEGDYMSVSYRTDGTFTMSFASPNTETLVVGQSTKTQFVFDADPSTRWNMDAKAIGPHHIFIEGVKKSVVYRMALSDTLTIKNFGRYSMAGTAAAIKALIQCVESVR